MEGFLSTYSKDIQIFDFLNELKTEGIEAMIKSYGKFFEKTTDLHCEIKKTIHIDNTIIDEELILINVSNFMAVAIYEVANRKIKCVTF